MYGMDACVASSYCALPSFIVGAFCNITQGKLIVLKNHTLLSLIWNRLHNCSHYIILYDYTYEQYELHLVYTFRIQLAVIQTNGNVLEPTCLCDIIECEVRCPGIPVFVFVRERMTGTIQLIVTVLYHPGWGQFPLQTAQWQTESCWYSFVASIRFSWFDCCSTLLNFSLSGLTIACSCR